MKDVPATKKDIDEILDLLRGSIQQTSDQFIEVNNRFDKMNQRFDKADERFNKFEFSVNYRFDKIESQFIDLQKSNDRLINTVDNFVSRIDRYETEQTARDSQFDRLLKWAKKVSKKPAYH